MQICDVIEGLQILAKYEDRGTLAFVAGADHDILYGAAAEIDYDAEPTLDEYGDECLRDKRLSDEDNARLVAIGWFIHDDDCWAAFV